MKLQNFSKILIIFYFVNLAIYSFFSLMGNEESGKYFWFMRIPILIVLYFITSREKRLIYFLALIFYQCTTVFFFTGIQDFFIYGTLASLLFKCCLMFIIADLVTKKNWKAIGLSVMPFFVLYLYVIQLVMESLGDTYYIWIANALITSFMGGVAIVHYLNNSDEKGFWLLISSILFVVQIAAFFINKFYVKSEGIYQLVILSYGISHFTFYKFLVLKEEETVSTY